MSFLYKIGLISLVLFFIVFYKCAKKKTVAAMDDIVTKDEALDVSESTDDKTFSECSEITRQVLITHCGSCHQSTLPTQKAGALAVFDLDKDAQWHEDLTEHHTKSIGNRLLNKSEISDEDKDAIENFLKLKAENINR